MGAGTFSSPAVFSVGNGNNYNPFIFVGSEDHKFYAFDKSGNVRWTARTSGVVDSSPAIGPDGTVYVGSTDHGLYASSPRAVPAPGHIRQ
jgi:outer membrane protein assembly factor BamB